MSHTAEIIAVGTELLGNIANVPQGPAALREP